jgi:Uma2 family endonuclease
MSAEAFGRHLPEVVTLDDLEAMNAADEFHRYEISPEGVLSIMPPAASAHALVASRLMAWLIMAGIPADRCLQGVGLRIPGHAGVGGRIPDLIVWGKLPADGVWLPVDDVLVAVEIVSPGSVDMDKLTKPHEYAAAGIAQYWVVDQDQAHTVTMYRLEGEKYVVRAAMPLAWVLNTSPAEHDLV